MSGWWAHDLPAFLDRWQVRHVEVDGWRTRSRSSGGFDDVMGVVVHHAADSPRTTPQGAFNWCCVSSPSKPIGNGYLDRKGVFHFWAAGASNTAGKGGPVWSSRGPIPADSANRRTFNIEAGNDGVGEVWTAEMVSAYPRLVAAVLDWANATTPGATLTAGDVWAHFEWAPTRKSDPFGPSRWAGKAKWDMDAYRGDIATLLAGKPSGPTKPPIDSTPIPNPPPAPAPPTDPDEEEEDMDWIACKLSNGSYWLGNGRRSRWASAELIDAAIAAGPVVDAGSQKRIAFTAGLTAVPAVKRDFLVGKPDPSMPTSV